MDTYTKYRCMRQNGISFLKIYIILSVLILIQFQIGTNYFKYIFNKSDYIVTEATIINISSKGTGKTRYAYAEIEFQINGIKHVENTLPFYNEKKGDTIKVAVNINDFSDVIRSKFGIPNIKLWNCLFIIYCIFMSVISGIFILYGTIQSKKVEEELERDG